jgi:HEAT repeat protein
LETALSYRGQSDKAQELAVSALADANPGVRIAAVDALRSLHATNAIDALTHTLQNENDDTAREHLRNAIRVLRQPARHDDAEQ